MAVSWLGTALSSVLPHGACPILPSLLPGPHVQHHAGRYIHVYIQCMYYIQCMCMCIFTVIVCMYVVLGGSKQESVCDGFCNPLPSVCFLSLISVRASHAQGE